MKHYLNKFYVMAVLFWNFLFALLISRHESNMLARLDANPTELFNEKRLAFDALSSTFYVFIETCLIVVFYILVIEITAWLLRKIWERAFRRG